MWTNQKKTAIRRANYSSVFVSIVHTTYQGGTNGASSGVPVDRRRSCEQIWNLQSRVDGVSDTTHKNQPYIPIFQLLHLLYRYTECRSTIRIVQQQQQNPFKRNESIFTKDYTFPVINCQGYPALPAHPQPPLSPAALPLGAHAPTRIPHRQGN